MFCSFCLVIHPESLQVVVGSNVKAGRGEPGYVNSILVKKQYVNLGGFLASETTNIQVSLSSSRPLIPNHPFYPRMLTTRDERFSGHLSHIPICERGRLREDLNMG